MLKSNFLLFFKRNIVLCISILYLFNPVQKQIIEVMHVFAHVIYSHNYSHHDHENEHKHTQTKVHNHTIISYFSGMINSLEKSDYNEDYSFFYSIDKHFIQKYPTFKFHFNKYTKPSYYYSFRIIISDQTILYPPPEILFS